MIQSTFPLVLAACLLLAGVSAAQTAPAAGAAPYDWSAVAADGTKVTVPVAGRATIVACVRPGQAQSRMTLDQIRTALAAAGAPPAQVVVLVSGERAADAPRQLGDAVAGWPVVIDPEFNATGVFDVHVWPTTIFVAPDGRRAGHLGGVNGSFSADLEDYLAFAAGQIDEPTLKKRLAEHHVVADGPAQRADRQATVAARLLDSGHVDQAAAAVEEGLKLRGDDPKLLVTQCRVLLARKQPAEALSTLSKVPAGAAPPWQVAEIRGKALVAMERWEEAKPALAEALKLNPRPAEAHYLLGQVHQHAGDWESAAKSFRAAYEARAAVSGSGT